MRSRFGSGASSKNNPTQPHFMFIKIDTKASIILVLAAAVIAWAVLAPESFQAAVNAVSDTIPFGVTWGG